MSSFGLVLGTGVAAGYAPNSRQEVTLTTDGSLRVAITAGGGGGGGSGGTVAQGAQAATANSGSAWYVQGVQGGTAFSIHGATQAGTPVDAYSVSTAGVDQNGIKQHIRTDTTGNVQVNDPNNGPFIRWPTIVPVSGTYTPAAGTKSLAFLCTVAGNLVLTGGLGNIMTIPIAIGFATLPFLPVSFTSTATATFYGLQNV